MIADHIKDELAAAGLLGVAMTWSPDGVLQFDPSVTPATRAAVEAVFAAHNPDSSSAIAAHTDKRNGGSFDTNLAVKALALVLLDELNALRVLAGQAERTPAQLRNAVLARMKAIGP